VRADVQEAVDKYGGAITLRRSNPESVLAPLYDQTVTVSEITIAYESKMLPNDAKQAAAVEKMVRKAASGPGITVIFR
jgi:hypothetical protein